jgi:methylated-DNA-[protein]-cysteine S-methyltransferase
MTTSVYYKLFSSMLGTMVLASDGDALIGAWFDGQRHQPAQGLSWQGRPELPILLRAEAELSEYFAGERTVFTLPLAPAGTPFQRDVWSAIAAIPYGKTAAYRELAERIGRPASIRAAGAATGRNPLSIIVPCHRVLGADGTLTGYAGGLDRKRALLALESRARAAPSVRRAA